MVVLWNKTFKPRGGTLLLQGRRYKDTHVKEILKHLSNRHKNNN